MTWSKVNGASGYEIYRSLKKGSGYKKVATIKKADLQKIAETKMKDLNAASLETAMSMIAGTCRSMGVTVEE